MYKEAIRPVWAEINLSNLDYNIKNIKAKLGSGTKIIGVVKADGYGHGSVKVAEVLRANGVDTFAVSTLQEAIVLREAGATEQIISLSLTPNFYSNVLVEYDITPVISSLENARAISKTAAEVGKTVSGFIAADTGMGRIGYLTWDENAVSEIKEISQLPNFKIAGLFSHMSTADSADKTFSRQQEQCFNEFYDKLIAAGIEIPMRTFANSASVMELPSVYFDAVRPGIILYGCYPSDEVDKSSLSLKPVMSVKATISHLKDVPAGFSVSYGREFISKRPSKIATIALGYADGYPRPYAPKGEVIVNGVKAPLAGNICMDQCMIDVTDVPDVKVGDEVIVMGSDGKNTILADDIAKATGTINYEIICAFGQRLPKVYVR
ncbi:MAG: alanine racemase [Eubacteriales bacterium]|nr:alanine racemase [Clostridiales bacterium]MDD7308321.1 alanine racemase [Eubacteriales bacterium]MDY2934403.1 alanine racemase [Anaerovoracaceae bacterium]